MNKDILIERIQKAQAILETALASLGDREENATGTMEHWTVKDTLAHMTAWRKNFVDWLAPALEGTRVEGAPRFGNGDDDKDNAIIFAENQNRPWTEVLEESRRVAGQMVRIIRALPDDDLNDPERFAAKTPLWKRIEGNFCWHFEGHLVRLFDERHDSTRGLLLAEDFASLVGADAPAAERATAIYNLACMYALAGQPEKSISGLKTALELDPGLVEWSKHDTDLDTLRERPDFQALYRS